MMQALLVPEKTTVTAKGDGPALELKPAQGRVFLLTLAITNIIEQESLDVSVCGSADGAAWDAKPVAAFPQKFYREEVPLLLDLTARPEVKFIRAHWEVARWGRGSETPMFEFHVALREVPQEILQEAAGRTRVR
ncbi:MAG: hypothetical protein HY233_05555 [Acidobacteriales bacterium]|nr:hypothetical protein [Candidatus Koribacter versatilis]MBI3645411.1 hypothetical protein [Terriglobales bacterium]